MESTLKEIIESMKPTNTIRFAQECSWEDVQHKQQIIAELDRLLDPSIVIASSTSFITWELLTNQCQQQHNNNKHRIMIGHPAIPHTHSYLEIYGTNVEWVQYCREFYTTTGGFDVVVLNKSIPGHVYNSFLLLNIDHGHKLVRQGVCSPQDINKAMRHLGRDMYGRHFYIGLWSWIGGDGGVQGGMEFTARIRKDAVFLIVYSALTEKGGLPNFLARPVSRFLGSLVDMLLPQAPEGFLRACEKYEEEITNGGQIPPQTALFNANSHMYDIIPLEVDRDPFCFPGGGAPS